MFKAFFQTQRKRSLSVPEQTLLSLVEGAKTVWREGSVYHDDYTYKITLECAYMEVGTADNRCMMQCTNQARNYSKVSDKFIKCVNYLWVLDRNRRNAEQAEKDRLELIETVNKFAECATNCPEKKDEVAP